MTFLQKRFLLGLLLLSTHFTFSQVDFNNFTPLLSTGKIPDDFLTSASSKVKEEMKNNKQNLSTKEKKEFLEGIHYGMDELLQSGLVIYGDEISKYVSEVADKLLASNSKLRKELRFYTIKSNVSNALSTDQGIVFVTTGLISQLTNEAQLAYVLAHEISHYTEKHVVETFEYRSQNKGMSKQINQLATYSKEKEFEADLLGLELYNKAGYTIDEITNVFDVLMYSYLPIDEIAMPKNYFDSPFCFIPADKYPTDKFEIKAEEDYDDSRSSHPNIRSRKDKAIEKADKLKNWGSTANFYGIEKFRYIRNLARFERLRNDVITASYGNALYTILILERDFPNSLYLSRMKAQSWLGLAAYKNANDFNQTVLSKSDLEGEGAAMHYFLKQLSEEELVTLAMRNVQDQRKKFPEDKEINAIWKKMIQELSKVNGIKLDEYHNYNFQEAVAKFQAGKDTLAEGKVEEEKPLSKYEKIRKKKNNTDPNNFDSTMFYLYNLSDLIENEEFKSIWKELEEEKAEEEEEQKRIDNLSRREREKEMKKKRNDEMKTDLSEFILVEPSAVSYSRGKINYSKSDELQTKYNEAFRDAADDHNLKVFNIDKAKFTELGTEGFNQKSLFTSLLIQVAQNDDVNCFPVDYSLINKIKAQYGTGKIVFTIVEHTYSPSINGNILYLVFFPPALPGAILYPFFSGNQTEINLVVLDTEKAEIVTGAQYYFKEPANQYLLQGRLYEILNNLNSKAK